MPRPQRRPRRPDDGPGARARRTPRPKAPRRRGRRHRRRFRYDRHASGRDARDGAVRTGAQSSRSRCGPTSRSATSCARSTQQQERAAGAGRRSWSNARQQLSDPAQVEIEARNRLHYVRPGETPYVVQLPGDAERKREEERPASKPAATQAVVRGAVGVGDARVLSEEDLAVVAEQLGRAPRGARAVAARCPSGHPSVVQTDPRLPDGTPFPTLYYLTCPRLTSLVSTLEGAGLMREMTERLRTDEELAAAYLRAHESYLAERDAIDSLGTRVTAGGMPTRVKCLHVHVAHALAVGRGVNPFGDEALERLRESWPGGNCA